MKKRILFVDDQPEILAGLKSLLHRHRNRWDTAFVQSGSEALERLAKEPFDAVVSDMRMPGMDGAALLAKVKEAYPQVARIVLSGYSDQAMALRATSVAHQFLNKPCDAATLENVLQRTLDLQDLISSAEVRRIVGEIGALPVLPKVYTELNQALAKEETTVQEVTAILEQDMAVCAKLLQIVNSAFFRLARRVSSIGEAVAYLGLDTVKNLVLVAKVFDVAMPSPELHGLPQALQTHSLYVASLCRSISSQESAEAAFTAGLLHDIGILVLAVGLPQQLKAALDLAKAENRPLHLAEQELYGTSHAEVGAYLLGLWGLPYPVVEAAANHHQPERVPQRDFDLLAATYTAECLAHETQRGFSDGSPLDVNYLASLNAESQLETWRAKARLEE